MAITRVNTANATGANVSSLNALLSSGAVTAGNGIVLHYSGEAFPGGTSPTFDVTDNINTGAYSTAAVSTQSGVGSGGMGIQYRLNISSGAVISTYRVGFAALSQIGFLSLNVYEYSGIGSFDKAGASSGVSSSPTGPVLSAANANSLWSAVGGTFTASTASMRSTGLPTGMTIIIVDPTSQNQLLGSGELIISSLSLTAQPTFRLPASTVWVAQTAIFAPAVAGAGTLSPWTMGLLGMQ